MIETFQVTYKTSTREFLVEVRTLIPADTMDAWERAEGAALELVNQVLDETDIKSAFANIETYWTCETPEGCAVLATGTRKKRPRSQSHRSSRPS
ncbi:hypothetical protein NE236_31810 [Actinoallomurus purpureus]|uniref:hypothetical protein n=1 Tax=Actinoallomurus purpureus TaxID=478114 RepID=UPI002093501F|nr:hypothetical protein [Actinoallomurus purpureus]MCO6009567.1 hypothetical protein [Actinoallomurus purpureus]